MISAVVTAAGRGSRMKRDLAELGLERVHKLLLPLKGGTVIEHTLAGVLDAGVDECIVVTGHHFMEVEERIRGFNVKTVRNSPPDVPLSESLLNGVRASGGDMVLCAAGDQPAVSSRTYRRLIEYSGDDRISILARRDTGWLQGAEGLGMPFVAPRRILLDYLPHGSGNINPLLWRMVEDGVRLYGVGAEDPVELININHYDDYLKIRRYFSSNGD